LGTIFILPEGYRPAMLQTFLQDANVGMARVDILPTGEVSVVAYKASGTNGYLSLAGISFPSAAIQGDTTITPITTAVRSQDIRVTGV